MFTNSTADQELNRSTSSPLPPPPPPPHFLCFSETSVCKLTLPTLLASYDFPLNNFFLKGKDGSRNSKEFLIYIHRLKEGRKENRRKKNRYSGGEGHRSRPCIAFLDASLLVRCCAECFFVACCIFSLLFDCFLSNCPRGMILTEVKS